MRGAFFQYGTAVHLAILTVAPLFLRAVCGPSLHAAFLSWLSLFAALWIVMNPSARAGEWPRDARHRIGWEILRDPFFTFGIVALVIAAIRAVNGGVSMTYEISTRMWHLTEPWVPLLPGSVTGAGLVPLAGTLALLVVTLGVRHALNSSARFFYLTASSLLAACAVLFWLAAGKYGLKIPALKPTPLSPEGLGCLLGVFFLLALAAWTMGWTREGGVFEILPSLSAGVLLTGLFLYAPTVVLWGFLPMGIAILAVGAVLAARRRRLSTWARSVVFLLLVLFPVALLVSGELAREPLWPVCTQKFLDLRAAASAVAVAGWKSATQLGLGLGAYPSAIGFYATADDWRVLTMAQTAAPDGWLQLLFERGLLGAVVLAAGLGLLLRDGITRYVRAGSDWTLTPMHLIGLFVLVTVAAVLFVDCTFVRIEALIPVCAALGLSAAAFPDAAEEDYG